MDYERLREDRKAVVDKIKEYEKKGYFDIDVENDPETVVLLPDKVDYLDKKPFAKLKNKIANRVAINYFEKEIKKKNFIIKDIIGIENFLSVKGGAIITCNHFSVYDNYAIFRAIRKHLNGHNLYKVIREGNYTSMTGLYGFFFRHCNTLPLSSDIRTMKKFLYAIDYLLKSGEKVLIYPEQAMWWNYRKPRPLKSGAFKFAVKSNVPVIPAFITLNESDKINDDGSNALEYTIHFLPPIYKKEGLSDKENIEYFKDTNFALWKELYEKTYNEKLSYGE